MTTPPSPRAGRAQTVLGLVAPESLGLTLPHEHLFVDLTLPLPRAAGRQRGGHERERIELSNLYEINYDWFSSRENLRLTDEATAIEEAAHLPAGRRPDPGRSHDGRDRPRPAGAPARRPGDRAPRHHGLGLLHGAGAPAGPGRGGRGRARARDRPRRRRRRRGHRGAGGADRRDRLLVALDARGAEVPAGGGPRRAGDRRPAHDPPRPRSPGSRGAPGRGPPRGARSPPGRHRPHRAHDRRRPGAAPRRRRHRLLRGVRPVRRRDLPLPLGRAGHAERQPSASGRSSGWWSRASAGRSCCRTTCASRSGSRATGARGSGTSLAGSCRAFDSAASPRPTSGRWSSRTPPGR